MMKMSKLLKMISLIVLLAGISGTAGAVVVSENDFSSAVKKEFAENGVEEALELEFYGGQTFFDLPEAAAARVMVSGLKFDEDQNRFSCRADVYADGKAYAATELSGKYYLLDEVWVPARNIKKGEIIAAGDLKKISFRRNRVKNANVVEKDKLAGKEAKRMLKEGKLVVDNDVGAKILIKKGDVVTAVYTTHHMQITTKAQAMSDGAEHDKIELVNTKSKKTIYGEVIDAETVKIEVQ